MSLNEMGPSQDPERILFLETSDGNVNNVKCMVSNLPWLTGIFLSDSLFLKNRIETNLDIVLLFIGNQKTV